MEIDDGWAETEKDWKWVLLMNGNWRWNWWCMETDNKKKCWADVDYERKLRMDVASEWTETDNEKHLQNFARTKCFGETRSRNEFSQSHTFILNIWCFRWDSSLEVSLFFERKEDQKDFWRTICWFANSLVFRCFGVVSMFLLKDTSCPLCSWTHLSPTSVDCSWLVGKKRDTEKNKTKQKTTVSRLRQQLASTLNHRFGSSGLFFFFFP